MMFVSPEALADRAGSNLPGPVRILLVDDQASNRLATRQLLRHLSCEADAAANGFEALELLQVRDYDVVLMDLRMPEMDGLEATRRLRLLDDGAGRPWVIALTADGSPEDRASCLEAGMDDFLVKPLTRARLIQALENRGAGPADDPCGWAAGGGVSVD